MADDHADQFYWTMTADLLASWRQDTISNTDLYVALQRIPHPVAKEAFEAIFEMDYLATPGNASWYIDSFMANFSARYGGNVEPVILHFIGNQSRIVA